MMLSSKLNNFSQIEYAFVSWIIFDEIAREGNVGFKHFILFICRKGVKYIRDEMG